MLNSMLEVLSCMQNLCELLDECFFYIIRYFEFQVHTSGDCSSALLQFELLYVTDNSELQFMQPLKGTEKILNCIQSILCFHYAETDLNRIFQKPSQFFYPNRTAELKWRSRAVTTNTSCCWMVTDTRIVDNITQATFPVHYCNRGNIQTHTCNDSQWICTLSEPPTEVGSIEPLAQLVSDQYIFTTNDIEGIRTVNACIDQPSVVFNSSTPPSEFCPSPVTITPTLTSTTILSPTSPSPNPTNGVLYCVADGEWSSTVSNTNDTVPGLCYGGTVEGIHVNPCIHVYVLFTNM